MAIVRKPGSIVTQDLPSDRDKPEDERTRLVLKVLNFDEWKQIARHLERVSFQSNESQILETARKVMGIGLEEIQNLRVIGENGEMEFFVLQKAGNEVTRESMAYLMPFKDEIIECIKRVSLFDETDAKN